MEVMPLNLLIVDDHELVVEGIKSQLSSLIPHIRINLLTDGKKITSILKEKRHDLYILDIELKDTSGFELIEAIRKTYPEAPILMNTYHEEIWYIKKMKDYGVNGVVFKSNCCEELCKAVTEILRGKTYFCTRFKELSNGRNGFHYLLKESLTKNEKDVLFLISQGYTNKTIANKKEWAIKTVEHYKKRLFDKFNVQNSSQLIAVSIKEGFLKKEEI